MWVKIVAYTPNQPDVGPYVPGEFVDLRDATAELFIKKGWAIARPDKEVKKKPEPEPVVERAVIETPEDSLPEQESATVKRRRINR